MPQCSYIRNELTHHMTLKPPLEFEHIKREEFLVILSTQTTKRCLPYDLPLFQPLDPERMNLKTVDLIPNQLYLRPSQQPVSLENKNYHYGSSV